MNRSDSLVHDRALLLLAQGLGALHVIETTAVGADFGASNIRLLLAVGTAVLHRETAPGIEHLEEIYGEVRPQDKPLRTLARGLVYYAERNDVLALAEARKVLPLLLKAIEQAREQHLTLLAHELTAQLAESEP